MKYKGQFVLFKLVLLLFFNNCYSYFAINQNESPHKDNQPIDSKKVIALIGFNDYEYVQRLFFPNEPKNEIAKILLRPKWGYRPAKRLASLSRSNKDFLQAFGIGKSLEEMKFRDYYPKTIDFHMLANHKFIEKEFADRTLQADMLYDLIFKSKYLRFQKEEIDYYVVAINSEPFQKSTLFGRSSIALSLIPSILTLTFLPIVDHQVSYTKFLIYGKNLELLDELEIENSYFVFHSFWKKENHACFVYGGLPITSRLQAPCIWEKNLEAGRDFVSEFLKEEMSLSEN
ncbi:Lp29 family lipoprotein [Leptospira stimsonii]|uniref:Lipoprotein n=1 Tax=Leptospira stimsonii TaxID=2202203 RepID=A0ABY2N320_9LEPT|nr:hypothetical protein [Leptospira stimsonii]TGK26934.1 hypothetical protein EHO98_00045 [Leptospira stimsonii]TGM14887.1 hypothetical protein EHQ90_10415 [Leptospira stimsonii]